MTKRFLLPIALGIMLSGCLTFQNARIWNPAMAVADAERAIAQKKVRFCYIGGWATHAPGLPSEAFAQISRYPRIAVGPQGCIMNEHSQADAEYAVRYNQRMWQFLTRRR